MHDTYFVMLNTQAGSITPLMDDEDIALFGSVEQAMQCADRNPLGEVYDYEVFQSGDGV